MCVLFSPGLRGFVDGRYGIRLDQVLVVGFSCLVLPVLFFGHTFFHRNSFIILMLGWFFLIFSTMLHSSDPAAYAPTLGFFRIFGFAALGYLIITQHNLSKVLRLQIIFSFVLAVVGLFQEFQFLNINRLLYSIFPGASENVFRNLPTTVFGSGELTARFVMFGYISALIAFRNHLLRNTIKTLVVFIFLVVYLFFFSIAEARGVNLALIVVTVFVLLKINLRFSFMLVSVGLVFIAFILSFLAQNIENFITYLPKNLIVRLERTWIDPVLDWLQSPSQFLIGNGLKMPYSDGGFTSIVGWWGVIGFICFYFPIFAIAYKLSTKFRENEFSENVFWFIIALLISNISYQSFYSGKQADLFWLLLGGLTRLIASSKKRVLS